MSQTLLEMAKELVVEQIREYQISPEEAQSLLYITHATLVNLEQSRSNTMSPPSPEETSQASWQRSITKHAVICMECGESFRQLSTRHLRRHNLDAKSYRLKYGIPRTQALSAFRATARRREIAHQIRPWEQAVRNRKRHASK